MNDDQIINQITMNFLPINSEYDPQDVFTDKGLLCRNTDTGQLVNIRYERVGLVEDGDTK